MIEPKQIVSINKRKDLNLLYNAIKYLKINNYIQMLMNENGLEEYLQGEKKFPQLYIYEQYCYEIPRY